MKTKLLFLLALSISFLATAQFTAIPDSNFEDALQSLGYDSGVNDGQVLTANINTITNLDINSKNISDLTGIEDFVALELLWFYTNTVSSVDLTQNINLKSLSTGGNNLTSLDLTKNTKLEQLSVVNNSISTLDLSKNTELLTFGITNNGLTSIDLSNNTKLQTVLIGNNDLTNLNLSKNTALISLTCDLMPNLVNLDLRNGNNNNVVAANFLDNPKLSCILVDDASFSAVTWTGAYAANTIFVESKSECSESYTNIPDDNFEQTLIDLGYDDELDDYITTANINTVTSLNVANKSISDLTGIEGFVAVKGLSIQDNNLTYVDLNNNLDLDNLSIYNNSLTNLYLSLNVKLFRINADNNEITELDLSQNVVLRDISVNNNKLTVLDVKNGNNANVTYFRAVGNPNLTCIQVDDVSVDASVWGKSSTASYSEDCKFNVTYIPDDNFEQALIDRGLDDVLDDYVNRFNIRDLSWIDVSDKNISDLTGIEDFIELTSLFAHNNSLTSIDVSKNVLLETLDVHNNSIEAINVTENTALKLLSAYTNNLTSLDVSKNSALETLWLSSNSLTTLDLKTNTALIDLDVGSNSLTTLDLKNNTALTGIDLVSNSLTILNVKNGNNQYLNSFNTIDNPDLACIEVDDASYSTINWLGIDATSSFSEDCNFITNISDANFEQALIDLGYDSGTVDGTVPTLNIINITDLNLFDKGITDVTGIEDFSALQTLNVANNSLTNLDVSSLTNLIALLTNNNSLGSLIINKNLETLIAGGNNLTELDFSENTKLTDIRVAFNPLTSLNIANGNNENITFIFASNTPDLFCIQVDDATYSATNWVGGSFTFDVASSFSEDCAATASIIDDQFNNTISVYPNPVNNILHININNNIQIKRVKLFNLLGKKLIDQKNTSIDFTKIQKGMYILKLESIEGKIAMKKILKN